MSKQRRRTPEERDALRAAIYAVAEMDQAGEHTAYLLPDGHSEPY